MRGATLKPVLSVVWGTVPAASGAPGSLSSSAHAGAPAASSSSNPLEYRENLDPQAYQEYLDRWVNAVFRAYRVHLVQAGREALQVRLDREVIEAELGLKARRAFKVHLVHQVRQEYRVHQVSREYRARWARRDQLVHPEKWGLPVRQDLSVLRVTVCKPSLYISANRSTAYTARIRFCRDGSRLPGGSR